MKLALVRHFLSARRRFHGLRGKALTEFQDRRARQVLAHARERSPYYRELCAGRPPEDWRELPVTDKRRMMERFSDFNTVGVRREDAMAVALRAEEDRNFRPTLRGFTVGLSSGTSGHRGLFLVDDRERAAWAGVVLARLLPSLRPQGFRVAFFLRSNSNLYTTLRSRWLDFRYFDLMLPPSQAAAELNRLQPDILAGPPALLDFLAASARQGELRIRPLKVVSFAEVLEPQVRERVREAFGAPVHEVYQCTEGLLAMSCPAGSLHVQEDLVALQAEPLGEGRFTPVITDLWRRVQPIIRYRMNDIVTFSGEACACGSAFRVLAGIEGRCDDVCYFAGAEGNWRPVFPDTVRRMVLLTPGVDDYEAVQDTPGSLRLHLEVSPAACFDTVAQCAREQVARVLAGHGCRAEQVTVEQGIEPLPPGAKRRRVRRVGGEGPA